MADKTIMIKTVQDILKEENEVRAEDFYSLASSIYDSFDIAAHNKGTGYMTTSFPLLNAKTGQVQCTCPHNFLFSKQDDKPGYVANDHLSRTTVASSFKQPT